MSLFIEKHYYAIVQVIDGKRHYYCRWEKLHPESKIWGIVWDWSLGWAFRDGGLFESKQQAKKMRSRIAAFDRKVPCKIVSINNSLIKKELEKLAQDEKK